MPDPAAKLRTKLSALGRLEDGRLRPVEALLTLAALDRPGTGLAPYLDYLDELAAAYRAVVATDSDADALAAGLFQILGRQHRFCGDDCDDDDIANANLLSVIDQRRGVAGHLGLLAQDVARRAGLAADILSFPAHVLLRLEDAGGRRVILDPFLGGRVVDPPDMRALLKASAGLQAELEPCHYAAMGNRDLVIRLQNDVKLRLLRCGRIDKAVAVVEATLLVAPDAAMLWREAGLMHLRLDQPQNAVAALEQFIARTSNAMARARTLALLAELKNRLT